MAGSRIALDVMGGDGAPAATLQGALKAIADTSPHDLSAGDILLVGDPERIREGLDALGGDPGFEIRPASQVIEMGDSPAVALRKKPDSSIAGCVAAIREGRASAMVSMGNTGACVGAATLGLGTLEGVRRAGIAVTLEFKGRAVTILDMGANIAPKPQHLFQYGVMGATYVRDVLGVESPRVGLLNVGEEPSKGTDLLKETHGLLSGGSLHFVGNIEGGLLFRDAADVVVTDGFTGNVVLKLLEDFAAFMMEQVLTELRAHEAGWVGEALANLRKNIDYSEYGGALLLGVNGTVVIGHGRSEAGAVSNALGLASRAVAANVNGHIVEGLAAVR